MRQATMPSPNAKRVQFGILIDPSKPKPMARHGTYVLATRIDRPKPMARTVTLRMRAVRAFWRAREATRVRWQMWLAARQIPGDYLVGPMIAIGVLIAAAVVHVWAI